MHSLFKNKNHSKRNGVFVTNSNTHNDRKGGLILTNTISNKNKNILMSLNKDVEDINYNKAHKGTENSGC